MSRARWFLSLALLAVPVVLHAATCDLAITVSCSPLHSGQASTCTSATINNGSTSCTVIFTGWAVEVPPQQVALTNFDSGIGAAATDCISSADDPASGEAYQFCIGNASIPPGGTIHTSIQVTPAIGAPSNLPVVAFAGSIDETDPEADFAFVYAFANATLPTCTPTVSTPPISQSGIDYTVSWTATTDQTNYQIDESTAADFSANLTSKTLQTTSTSYSHSVSANTTYFYRVHALNCSGAPGPLSATVSTVVQAPPPPSSPAFDSVVPLGSNQPVTFQIFVPGAFAKKALDTVTFNAATDQTYLKVTPSSGTLPPTGTTLTVTAQPQNLPPGANTGTVTVTPSNGAVINTPVSVSLVTPVAIGGKGLPPANALIIPVVGHLNSAAGPFQSDVRVTNAGTAPISYQITFTPTQTDGTQNGRVTSFTINGGQTIAMNDIAKDFFGFGATGGTNDFAFGSLEIRPINNSSLATYASSRTFATTSSGTYGQFVAAVPFGAFAGPATSLFGGSAGPTVISLQQVAESAKFRTNLGLVEGSGTPASGRIRVLDDLGNLLKELPYSLRPGEHQQLNQYIRNVAGIQNLDDGRIEITVDSPTGAITAYASVLDNVTADPLAVMPVQASEISATRYVVPGMVEVVTPFSNFHSDMRIFNGGQTAVTVTPTFYPQGNGTPVSAAPITIGANQVKAYDNVIQSLFHVTGTGGSVLLTTPTDSSLVATGRTYSNDNHNGTFGQFIPGVSPDQGIGAGETPLQLLQLEQSSKFRSNVGIAELSGSSANVKLTIIPPDGRVSGIVNYTLQPNEFHQFDRIIEQVYGSGTQMYNARIVIEVTGGSGRVAAYGSVLDNSSLDPTYVPAQ